MRVAVLGAGLQGACVALELAAHGVAVDLYDRCDRPVTQASAQNEGKVHLGYVYGNDPSLQTARAMLRGALAFGPLLRRWLGAGAVDRLPTSAPFLYAVHRASLLAPDAVAAHLRCCQALARDLLGDDPPDYFGLDPREAPVRLRASDLEAAFDPRTVVAAFRTPEVGIDPEALAALVRDALAAEPRLRFRPHSEVRAAEPDADGVTVAFDGPDGPGRARYDHVVNALWDGRLAVDRTAGVAPPRPWLHRVKHFLRVHAPGRAASVPSATVVLGAFGDTVAYGTDHLYLSWYPAGMRGASDALVPPPWPLPLPDAEAAEVRAGILDGLARIVPAVRGLSEAVTAAASVRGGRIFAWGQTDIDDPASGLHERHAIGPRSYGRYHTVDTGKLTTAPLYAKVVADRVRAAVGTR